jgi:hypothetical protein
MPGVVAMADDDEIPVVDRTLARQIRAEPDHRKGGAATGSVHAVLPAQVVASPPGTQVRWRAGPA